MEKKYLVEVFSPREGDSVYDCEHKEKSKAYEQAKKLSTNYKGDCNIAVYEIVDGYAVSRCDFYNGRPCDVYEL